MDQREDAYRQQDQLLPLKAMDNGGRCESVSKSRRARNNIHKSKGKPGIPQNQLALPTCLTGPIDLWLSDGCVLMVGTMTSATRGCLRACGTVHHYGGGEKMAFEDFTG